MSRKRDSGWLDANGYDHVSMADPKWMYIDVDDGVNSNRTSITLQTLIQEFPDKIKSVVNSALKRATASGQTVASKAVREEYDVSATGFKENTKSSRTISTDGNGGLTVNIKYAGYHIPLIQFKASRGADGIVRANVVKGGMKIDFTHAFFARFGNGTNRRGIYERNTKKRFPIHQILGPSAAQMMWSKDHDGVRKAISSRIQSVYEERMEHEVLALMNGWRN